MQTHPQRFSFAALVLALALACVGAGCTPSGPKALLQGAELVRKGKHEAAIEKLKVAKGLLPNDARAWNYLGLAYHGAGQYGEAIIHYQRAQELDKNLAEARYNLGELFLEQGNPVSAAEELTVFTALRPKSVEGWVRLGDAQLQNQRADRAQTSYYTALNLKRETPEAFNGLGLILLQRKNPRDAYRYFVEANKYDPDYAPAILNMAVVAQAHLSSPPTALARYREYLAKAPEAANVSEVQAAIRQLDGALNPQSAAPKVVEPPAETAVTLAASSNTVAPPVAQSEARPTNAPAATRTNTPLVAAVRTNTPAATPASHGRTNIARENDTPRAATATNKAPTQVASRGPIATDKPAAAQTPTASAEKVAQTPAAASTDKAATPAETASPASAGVASDSGVSEPPLEEVRIGETTLQPADDVAAARDIEAPPATTPPPQNVATAPAGQEVTTEKRGFFRRINPVNLFRSDKSDAPAPKRSSEIVTPLPSDSAQASPAAPAAATPSTLASASQPEVVEPPGTPAALRYQYGRIKKPVAGDRPAAERLFERGIGAQTRRDPSGAASFFSASVQADATYFPAHYNLGLAGYSSGQWFNALSAFETALVLDPNSADARYNFALTLQKARFPVDAARELEKLLDQKPNDTRAMLLLGNVYSQDLNNVASARRMYQGLLAREPQHPQATAIRYWLAQHP